MDKMVYALHRDSKLNLLLVIPWWFPDQGGVVTAVNNLSMMLKERGYGVTLLVPSPSREMEGSSVQDDIELHRIYLRNPVIKNNLIKGIVAFIAFFPWTIIKLWKLVNKNHIGIINIHYPSDQAIYFIILKLVFGKKLVVSIWGADISINPGKSKITFYIMHKMFILADVVIACSNNFLSEAIKKFPIIKQKSIVIYPGVDIGKFSRLYRKKTSNFTMKRYLLSVANLEKWKGIDTLILAFKEVVGKIDDVNLLIAGDGPERNTLEGLVTRLGISSRVFFSGRADQTEVITLFQNCEFFILPSRVEPFGIVFLEAFACKKTVIATNTGGIPEFVENAINGLLVEPDQVPQLAEKIIHLLTDQDLRRSLADNGYLMVKNHFSWDTATENYLTVIDGLIP